MEITVLGAGRCVTGSKYHLQWKRHSALVDCGLFQGPAEHRRRNWAPLPHPAGELGAVLITHAHIDHSGYLPRLTRQGFSGPVYCTPPTLDLLRVLLPDAAKIQEEEARYANRRGYSKHAPALPLFRMADAMAALRLLEPVPFGSWRELHPGVRFRYHRQGHILGAAAIEIDTKGREGGRTTVFFSGDVGRYGVPILRDPEPYPGSEVLFVESTYGDRRHPTGDPRAALVEEIRAGLGRGGVIVIPAFAVDRTQELLYLLHEAVVEGELPAIPTWLDSPMGIEATALYSRARAEHDAEMRQYFAEDTNPIFPPNLGVTPTSSESRKLNDLRGPAIIISASGMATGGRVLHHLARRLPEARNSLVLVGYQAEGTRGRALLRGATTLKMHGRYVPVRAEIVDASGFSVHADGGELVEWLASAPAAPRTVFVVHGEAEAAFALQRAIGERIGSIAVVPQHGERVRLD